MQNTNTYVSEGGLVSSKGEKSGLTLVEAAARFRELDAGMPETRDRLAKEYPGVPYEVALCRQVIAHALSALQVRALEQVERAVPRGEADLQAPWEGEGALRLP